MGKDCTKCGEYKDYSEYNKCSITACGYQKYCRECQKAYRTKYYNNKRKHIIQEVRNYVCKYPGGVYMLNTNKGRYIGQSAHIEHRVRNHKCPNSELKQKGWKSNHRVLGGIRV